MSDEQDQDQRAAKRLKIHNTAVAPITPITPTFPKDMPETIVDVCPDGDVILVVKSIQGQANEIGIRVSSHVLSLTSPGLKKLIESADGDNDSSTSSGPAAVKTIPLPDDKDAVLLLSNVLHLRNDKLPSRIQPMLLMRYIETAVRYACVNAASRAACPWLDHIYQQLERTGKTEMPLLKLISIAFVLDDPIYFARFTSKWVCTATPASAAAEVAENKRAGKEMIAKREMSVARLRKDLDSLLEPLAEGLRSDAMHYVNCAPGELPGDDEDDDQTMNTEDVRECEVDKKRAMQFLAALRDAGIWPASKWPKQLEAVMRSIADFKLPNYDSNEACAYCEMVENRFVSILEKTKREHKERLWGLCLDCYKAGGPLVGGECRVEHLKPQRSRTGLPAGGDTFGDTQDEGENGN